MIAQLSAGAGLRDGVSEEHVRYSKIAGRARRNILFIVDTSGSMIASGRLSLVKGCVVSLLTDAYVTRTRVAIIGYGGVRARLMLPFTSSAELAAQRIDEAKGGGATPLLDALSLAMRVMDGMRGEPVEIVLLSDGGFDRSRHVQSKTVIRGFGEFCGKRGAPIFFVDSGNSRRTAQQRAKRLASELGADYHCLEDLRAENLVQTVGQDG